MTIVTISVLFWCSVRIVYWLSHEPTLYGVLSLILPLLILPLMSAAYAEVNYEGRQVLQSILPTIGKYPYYQTTYFKSEACLMVIQFFFSERTALFRYLYGMPIELNVYGHPITYGTMGTVLAAILAAFASRIFIQEVNKIL